MTELSAIRLNVYRILAEKNSQETKLVCSESVIKKVLKGKQDITEKNKEDIANILGITKEELVDTKEFDKNRQLLNNHDHLFDLYDNTGKNLITANGKQFIKNLSPNSLFNIVGDVLCGSNVRDITEFITRDRLLLSNASILKLFLDSNLHEYSNSRFK